MTQNVISMRVLVYLGDIGTCICGGQRLVLGVFLYCSPLSFADTRSPTEPGAHQLGKTRGKYRGTHYIGRDCVLIPSDFLKADLDFS